MLVLTAYFMWGHAWVDAAYRGTGWPLFNRIISGQSVWSLAHYIEIADRIAYSILLDALAAWAVFILLFWGVSWRGWDFATLKIGPALGLLGLLFLISIVVRLPYVMRPMADMLESATAHVMTTLDNFETQGVLNSKMAVIQTYPGKADRNIASFATCVFDWQGRGYYTSAPAGYVLAPYFVFKLFRAPIELLSLRIFSLAGHLFMTLCVFTAAWLGFRGEKFGGAAALAAAALFIFLAPNLWFFCNFYNWDTLGHYFWAVGIVAAMGFTVRAQQGRLRVSALWSLALAVFLVTLSDYAGVLFGASLLVLAWTAWRPFVPAWKTSLLIVAASGVAVAILGVHYLWIADFDPWPLWASMVRRSSLGALKQEGSYAEIGRRFIRLEWPLLVPLAVLGFLVFRGAQQRLPGRVRILLFLAAFPWIAYYMLFAQWTAVHACAITRASFFIAFAVGVLAQQALAASEGQAFRLALIPASLVLACALSTQILRDQLAVCSNPAKYRDLGLSLQRQVRPDEILFCNRAGWADGMPQVVYYSKRNIQFADSREEAESFLRPRGWPQGRLFMVDSVGDRFWIRDVFSIGGPPEP